MEQAFSPEKTEKERELLLKEKEAVQAQIEELFEKERDQKVAESRREVKVSEEDVRLYQVDKEEFEMYFKMNKLKVQLKTLAQQSIDMDSQIKESRAASVQAIKA